MEYVPYLLTAYAIFAMAVMSPGPNFLAVTSASMTIVLRPDAPGWVGLAIVLGTTTFSFGWHLALAWFFSTEAVMRVYRRAYRAIQGVMGTAFVLLGGRMIAN